MDTHNQQDSASRTGHASNQQVLKDLENWFHKLYLKVPFHLPPSVKEFIVHFGPWLALVLIILVIPSILLALTFGTIALPFAAIYGQASTGGMFLVNSLITLAVLILEAMALPGLFRRQIKGWRFMFYASLVTAVGSFVSMNLGALVLGTALSMYLLFEIKEYYK